MIFTLQDVYFEATAHPGDVVEIGNRHDSKSSVMS